MESKVTYIVEKGDSAVEVTVIDGSRKVELPMKKCPYCDGEGDYLVEEPVVDYVHGGYLQEKRITCEECHGNRFVVIEDE